MWKKDQCHTEGEDRLKVSLHLLFDSICRNQSPPWQLWVCYHCSSSSLNSQVLPCTWEHIFHQSQIEMEYVLQWRRGMGISKKSIVYMKMGHVWVGMYVCHVYGNNHEVNGINHYSWEKSIYLVTENNCSQIIHYCVNAHKHALMSNSQLLTHHAHPRSKVIPMPISHAWIYTGFYIFKRKVT
jgi:hypothetical protein